MSLQLSSTEATKATLDLIGKALASNSLPLRGASSDPGTNTQNAKCDSEYLNAIINSIYANLKS